MGVIKGAQNRKSIWTYGKCIVTLKSIVTRVSTHSHTHCTHSLNRFLHSRLVCMRQTMFFKSIPSCRGSVGIERDRHKQIHVFVGNLDSRKLLRQQFHIQTVKFQLTIDKVIYILLAYTGVFHSPLPNGKV